MLAQFGAKGALEKYPIINVSPDGFTQYKGIDLGKHRKRSFFHPNSPFIKVFTEQLTYVDIAQEHIKRIEPKKRHLIIPHFMGETRLLNTFLPQIHLTTSTFKPDADPETNTFDGIVFRAGVDVSLSTLIAGNGTGISDASAAERTAGIRASTTSGQYQNIVRGLFLFNTATLPDTDGIDAGTKIGFYGHASTTNGLSGQASANSVNVLVESTTTSDTGATASDYQAIGSVDFGRSAQQDSWNTGSYNDITMNASGRANISKTAISYFGTRYGWDFDDTTTGLTWASNATQATYAEHAENGSNEPLLTVEHSVPSVPSGFLAIL